ncbi:MAG: hypothetical protein ACI9KE_000846 [Polyangiales bacterium]|jgi:hypothetical protein
MLIGPMTGLSLDFELPWIMYAGAVLFVLVPAGALVAAWRMRRAEKRHDGESEERPQAF